MERSGSWQKVCRAASEAALGYRPLGSQLGGRGVAAAVGGASAGNGLDDDAGDSPPATANRFAGRLGLIGGVGAGWTGRTFPTSSFHEYLVGANPVANLKY